MDINEHRITSPSVDHTAEAEALRGIVQQQMEQLALRDAEIATLRGSIDTLAATARLEPVRVVVSLDERALLAILAAGMLAFPGHIENGACYGATRALDEIDAHIKGE
jgi:hypothetical protein